MDTKVPRSKVWQPSIAVIKQESKSEHVTEAYIRLYEDLIRGKPVIIISCADVGEMIEKFIKARETVELIGCWMCFSSFIFTEVGLHHTAVAMASTGLATQLVHILTWELDPLGPYVIQSTKAPKPVKEDVDLPKQLVLVRKPKTVYFLAKGALAVSSVAVIAYCLWRCVKGEP